MIDAYLPRSAGQSDEDYRRRVRENYEQQRRSVIEMCEADNVDPTPYLRLVPGQTKWWLRPVRRAS